MSEYHHESGETRDGASLSGPPGRAEGPERQARLGDTAARARRCLESRCKRPLDHHHHHRVTSCTGDVKPAVTQAAHGLDEPQQAGLHVGSRTRNQELAGPLEGQRTPVPWPGPTRTVRVQPGRGPDPRAGPAGGLEAGHSGDGSRSRADRPRDHDPSKTRNMQVVFR